MRCRAALNVKGAGYDCDLEAPHPGWAHANKDGQAFWCSHGEATRHVNRPPKP